MSLLSIAVEQREKEAQTLNSFLAFSLIGSLALHAGVLGLGIGKFLSKAPEIENEPLEIAIVELPNPQKLELEPEKANGSTARNDRAILSSSGGSEGFGAASSGGASQQKSSEVVKAQSAPQRSSQPISKAIPTPPQNQKVTLEKVPAVVTQSKPVVAPARTAPAKPVAAPAQVPSEIVSQPKPVVTSSPVPVASAKPPTVDRSSQIQQLNNQRLNGLLAEAKNAREASRVDNSTAISDRQSKIAANLRNQTGSGTNNGVGNSASNQSRSNSAGTGNVATAGNGGTSNGTNRGTGNSTGTSNNNGTGRGNNVQSGSTVATGSRNTERRISPAESDSNPNPASSSGRLACRSCSKPKYPERARRRGIEGKAEISVDVDSKGNVTKVRLARTSGHAELDKAALEQARDWKFKAPNGAAQGVTAKVDFAIEGSKKSRQIRERRRQRAARKQPVASSQNTRAQSSTQTTNITRTPARQNTNPAPTRTLRRQSTTVRRRVDTLPPRQASDSPQRQQRRQSAVRQSPSQTRLRNTLKRSPRAASPNQTRRRRQQPQTTSPNQTKLRQSLRLHQEKSTPTPNEP